MDGTLGEVLLLENLGKQIVIVVDWCFMCYESGESIYHLLYCEVARVMELFFNFFSGVDLVMDRKVRELLMFFFFCFGGGEQEWVCYMMEVFGPICSV